MQTNPTVADVVCRTTPARRDSDMLEFTVWTELCRCVEDSIMQEADR